MREKNGNHKQETETAFAASIILTNILLLAVVVGMVWLVHFAISSNSELNAFLRGAVVQQ